MANSIKEIVELIKDNPDCEVYSPTGLPTIDSKHVMPDDVREFYSICGGVVFNKDSEYIVEILSPTEVTLANPKMFIGVSTEDLDATKDDISWSWYFVGQGDYGGGESIVIDFDQTRLGRCYFTFWDRHAMKGHNPIIAFSFTELLSSLLESKSEDYYWEEPDFDLGDAYD